ncbi:MULTISPECIES: tetratricopeptide repeat protein [Gracilibacillus]|uniref:tetratricopeptide repeat protein n=1 Tax=Gracilibacillus TaxID=74385 RepID=UPI000824DD77|nr:MULTISPECIES: tetratricopeptide repeat protein [Gracilibacillus]
MSKNQLLQDNLIPFIPDGEFYFTKGVEAYQKRKFDLSLKWFQKAVEQKPTNPLYLCQASIVHTEVGEYHLANQLLTKVLAHHGEEYVDCYYLLANNYAHLGLIQDAIKYTTLYLEHNTDNEFEEEAEELLHMLDGVEEETDEDWLLEEEDDLLMYQETAFYHLEREEWADAIAILEEMITLFPEFPQARQEYHYALFYAGERDKAIALEENYWQEHPNTLFSCMNLTVFYHDIKEQEKTDGFIALLDNIYPLHEQQKLRMAVTFAHVGLYQKALQRFKLLHKSKLKGHPSYYKWFSLCHYQAGTSVMADRLWEEGCRQHQVLADQRPPWQK